MKDGLGGKVMTICSITTKNYLTDDNNENKKVKGTKNCIIKRKLKCQDYKDRLQATRLENRTNQLGKRSLM